MTTPTTTIFFHDMSGSTQGQQNYHTLSLKIYNEQVKNKNHIIVGWDDKYKVLDDNTYINICYMRKGYNGTLTSQIGKYLSTLNSTNSLELIIITDGQVDISDIAKCDEYISNLNLDIKKVTAYISYYSANCSVLAPFMRGSWDCEIFHDNHTQIKSIYTLHQKERNKLMEIVKTATTEEEINAVFDKLIDMVTSITMGKSTGDSNLRNDILVMANRIKQNVKSNLSKCNQLEAFEKELVDNKSVNIQTAQNLYKFYKDSFNGNNFQSKIDTILQMCDGKLSHMFDPTQIRAQALNRATVKTNNLTNEQMNEINDIPTDMKPVDCPIMLIDSPNMVLMIKSGTPIFEQIEKKTQDSIMLNTFYTFNAQICSDLIKQRLDHYMSLEAYTALQSTKSPMTNSNLCGCLVLGTDPLSVKATNHTIGQMVLGKSGLIGNADIWFYTIYKLVKSGDLPWLNDILPNLEAQMKYRLLNSKCTLSMSGLIPHIQLKSNLANSLYFTLMQPLFIKNKEESSFPNFSGSVEHMLSLLELCEYKFQNENLYKYFKIINICSRLVYDVKQLHIEPFHNKYDTLFQPYYQVKLEKLSQEYKDYVIQNNTYYEYIPFDSLLCGIPQYAQKFTDEEKVLYYNLSKLIQSESITTFSLDINIDNLEYFYKVPTKRVNSWKLYDYLKDDNTVICRKTMRPWTYVGNVHWKDSFLSTYNSDNHMKSSDIFSNTPERRPLGQVFSGVKYYAEFVTRFGIYPNVDDLILYSYNIVKNSQYAHYSLPCMEFMNNTINMYEFTKDIYVVDFVNLYERSRNRDDRLYMETKSDNDNGNNILQNLNLDKIIM
jgi:hypothetical protein